MREDRGEERDKGGNIVYLINVDPGFGFDEFLVLSSGVHLPAFIINKRARRRGGKEFCEKGGRGSTYHLHRIGG